MSPGKGKENTMHLYRESTNKNVSLSQFILRQREHTNKCPK